MTGPAVGAIEPVTSIVLRLGTRVLSVRELSVRVLSWLRRSRDMPRQQAIVMAEMRGSIGQTNRRRLATLGLPGVQRFGGWGPLEAHLPKEKPELLLPREDLGLRPGEWKGD